MNRKELIILLYLVAICFYAFAMIALLKADFLLGIFLFALGAVFFCLGVMIQVKNKS